MVWNAISNDEIINHKNNIINVITPSNKWDFNDIENNILSDLNGDNNGIISNSLQSGALADICCNDPLNDEDDDGICGDLEIYGCTDETACNFDEIATENNFNCTYSNEIYNCDGACITDSDNDSICDIYDSCPYDSQNDIDGDGLCCSGSSFLQFDGTNDYASLGSYNSYNLNSPTQSFTVNVKAKVNQFSDFQESYILGTPMFSGNNDRGFRIQAGNESFAAVVGGNNNMIIATSDVNSIQENKWYDITMVLNQGELCGECGGDSLFLYIDLANYIDSKNL